jgi:polyribonucleotide 5'-hydroxyl-kinase
MQNSILAIVHADPNDTQENIRDASVIGFVYVAEVDEKRKKLKILAPLSGRLPNRAMIWGTWPEGVGDLVG